MKVALGEVGCASLLEQRQEAELYCHDDGGDAPAKVKEKSCEHQRALSSPRVAEAAPGAA